ncbi:hypothetical protein [Bacteroides sp. 519]|uniref:hypothetical protein n=1 Tax=Bacteroides sp. 519 TaxID=2302937 RepID=UPI0013D5E756|nr:hypothetical protein [Bacteroides sp. 519]NDV59671.1 hypothetical protein [Bacteroides sp. 519]
MKKINNVLCIFLFVFWYLLIAMGVLYLTCEAIGKWEMEYKEVPLAGVKGLAGFVGELLICLIFIGILLLAIFIFSFAFSKSAMPHIICSRPKKLEPNVFFEKNVSGVQIRADDKFIIFEDRPTKIIYWIFGIILSAFFFALVLTWQNGDFFSNGTGIFSFATLLFLIYFINIIVHPVKRVVFDRMNGTVSLPGIFGIFPRNTIPFSEVQVGVFYGHMIFQYAKYLHLGVTVWYEYNAETWYMLLQYMDKNYPLPCGSVFDPYRKQDFKRRQSEGFPKPTCMSYVCLTDETCG